VKDAQTHRVYLARACGISFALEQRMRVMSDQAGVVIKDDIKFAGQRVQIVSQSKIEIDCEFEGDVTGPEVVVSKRGRVRGIVAGERVTVLGRIVGDIRGKTIALMSSAHVEGDIHHNSLLIENGAELTGRCRQNEASAWSGGKKSGA
jgi:cytoskeletal protein CcmA (bactofilin family)